MTRTSALVLIATIGVVPATSLAQGNTSSSPPPGTNSAGTAQSSGGAPNREPGVTTGTALGTGNATPPPTPGSDAAINQENATIDRKLKSICRGC
jgi:hypothetical protein